MVDVEAMRSELETLLKELATRGPADGSSQEGPGQGGEMADDRDARSYAGALQKLSEYLTGGTNKAEETLAAHPLAAVGAAFMLGVAVGRMSRG